MLVGDRANKPLPPIALLFKKALRDRGWTPTRLAEEASKRFGDDAAVPQSFRRLVRHDAPESDSKTVIQASAILEVPLDDIPNDGPKLAVERMAEDEPAVSAIAPLIDFIPAARDADEETIVAASRKLMGGRHASLHALLTLMLAKD